MTGKKIDFNEKKIMGHAVEAKKAMLAKKQPLAMKHMRAKKRLELGQKNLQGQIENLEAQQSALETFISSMQQIDAQESVVRVMQQLQPDIDRLAEIQDEQRDLVQGINEVSAMLAEPLGPELDQDEMQAELDAMMQEDLDGELEAMGGEEEAAPVAFPAVPTKKLAHQDPDHDEMAALNAEMEAMVAN